MRPEYRQIRGTERGQDSLDKRRKILFTPEVGANVRTLADVIYKMVILKKDTVYPRGGLQCEGWRRRSCDDIYMVAKNYVPNITLQKVRKALSDLRSRDLIWNGYCWTVNKTVHTIKRAILPTLAEIKQVVKI